MCAALIYIKTDAELLLPAACNVCSFRFECVSGLCDFGEPCCRVAVPSCMQHGQGTFMLFSTSSLLELTSVHETIRLVSSRKRKEKEKKRKENMTPLGVLYREA